MINLKEVSLILITKDSVYPQEILRHVSSFGFGEILILTNSDSPFRKHEMFAKAKYDTLAYQDDDALCPWMGLASGYNGTMTIAMKPAHLVAHQDNRATMGIGWGAIFPKSILSSLKKYTDIYGEDDVYKRETERILTYLNFPQNRIVLPITDLPSAFAEDRLWRQENHISFKQIAEERCREIIEHDKKK